MKKNKRLIRFIVFGLFSILLFGIYYFISSKFDFYIPCIFHEITGFYCPGCGITRMLFSLFKLDFYQAFRYNSLLFISLPFIIFCFLDIIIKFLFYSDNYFYKRISNRVWYFFIVITIIFGIMRNIPMFDYLKPTLVWSYW